ncbi:MAG TPA: S41 family peptidase [Pirellulaceae bacterium]|nr:S41 family peptidase [Pirellulaceae bacterium]
MDVHLGAKLIWLVGAIWFNSAVGLWSQVDRPVPGEQPASWMAPQPAHQSALQQALEYESREQWADALMVYQQALKHQPHDPTLLHKRALARIHYDLARRYNDQSYLNQVQQLDYRRASNLYAEVLQKIGSYHVETPDWHALSRYGLTSLQTALGQRVFRDQFLARRSDEQVNRAWESLQIALQNVAVRSRTDSIWVADRTAQIMQDQLGLSPTVVFHEFVCGATASLDLYSSFLTQDQYQDTMSQIDGNFVGLGVELKLQRDALDIVNVIHHGPAGRGGIRAGDKILAVNDQAVSQIGAEKCADLLRGPEGTFVSVQVQQANGQINTLSLQRRRVEIPSFDQVSIIDATHGIAYARLVNFQKTTGQDLDAALWQLHQQGMRHLIVDVRGNPGGLLTAAVDVANRFIDRGILVSTKGRNTLEDFTHQAQAEGTWRVPLIVLIDENSASASEIFAAAIADHGRGTIVGQQSYGKGSVQGIFPLGGSAGGLRLTTALFYSPRGTAISQRGVVPDIAVQQTAKLTIHDQENSAKPSAEDPTLRAAVNLFQRPSNPAASHRAATDHALPPVTNQ